VLEHLPSRDAVLARLIDLVGPGGWIVVEDVDVQVAVRGDEAEVSARSAEAATLQAKWWRRRITAAWVADALGAAAR
jgi:2-polyprenyl-3-methyl-5-hydroxy-6-metoxy-1,4-benzoquinol methylase